VYMISSVQVHEYTPLKILSFRAHSERGTRGYLHTIAKPCLIHPDFPRDFIIRIIA